MTDQTARALVEPFVSATCEGERCHCGEPAVRKVGEEIPIDDPMPRRHNLTAYVCARHYAELMGPLGAQHVGYSTPPEGDTPGVNCPDCGGRIATACPYCGAQPTDIAALQSRVSPQEGLREALEEACGALSRIEKAPAWGAPERWETTPAEVRWLARDTLTKIDAALSASRMSDL